MGCGRGLLGVGFGSGARRVGEDGTHGGEDTRQLLIGHAFPLGRLGSTRLFVVLDGELEVGNTLELFAVHLGTAGAQGEGNHATLGRGVGIHLDHRLVLGIVGNEAPVGDEVIPAGVVLGLAVVAVEDEVAILGLGGLGKLGEGEDCEALIGGQVLGVNIGTADDGGQGFGGGLGCGGSDSGHFFHSGYPFSRGNHSIE